MASMKEVRRGRVLIGRLDHGADLLGEIASLCRGADIRLARIQAIGAVQKARLAYYDQAGKTYRSFEFSQPLEILSLAGNVSIRDEEPAVHAHLVLGDAKGNAFGGHLAEGTVVFACECIVEELVGAELVRAYDAPTGLPLWNIQSLERKVNREQG